MLSCIQAPLCLRSYIQPLYWEATEIILDYSSLQLLVSLLRQATIQTNLVAGVITNKSIKIIFRRFLLVQKLIKRMVVSGMTNDTPEIAAMFEESERDVYCANEQDVPPSENNWKTERIHRSLKNFLRVRLLGRVNWLSELSWVMLGLRAESHLDTLIRRRFWSLVINPHYRVSWWYKDQLSMMLPTSAENWRLLWQLKHFTRTHGSSAVHRPISGITTLQEVHVFAVGEPRGNRLCRQTTSILQGRDGSSGTGYRRRRHRENDMIDDGYSVEATI